MKIICWLNISICAVSLLTARIWINPVAFIQKCNIQIMKIDDTIFHQINVICKQISLMSKKYSYSCSSWSQIFDRPNNFVPKFFCTQNFLWIQFFWPTNFWPKIFGPTIGFSGKFELAIWSSVVSIAQLVSPSVALLAKLV